jgi:hypothetical protein
MLAPQTNVAIALPFPNRSNDAPRDRTYFDPEAVIAHLVERGVLAPNGRSLAYVQTILAAPPEALRVERSRAGHTRVAGRSCDTSERRAYRRRSTGWRSRVPSTLTGRSYAAVRFVSRRRRRVTRISSPCRTRFAASRGCDRRSCGA